MAKRPSEYDVAFAVKEWLIAHDWDMVAFNPPGAQGTFSIPNPAKDPKYRGQTGTQAPDIIAAKGNHVLVAECKDYGRSKVLGDVEKILKLVLNTERADLLRRLVAGACSANGIAVPENAHIIVAVAYGGEFLVTEITDKARSVEGELEGSMNGGMQSFHIEITDDERNPDVMDKDIDPLSSIKTTLYPTECDIEDILLCGGQNGRAPD